VDPETKRRELLKQLEKKRQDKINKNHKFAKKKDITDDFNFYGGV
jgi:hypothetical protein